MRGPDRIVRGECVGEQLLEAGDIALLTSAALHQVETIGDALVVSLNLYARADASFERTELECVAAVG